MRRQDTWHESITLTFRGETVDLGVCKTFEGADVESEDVRNKPGGMLPEESLGGSSTRNSATVALSYTDRIHSLYRWIDDAAGKGDVVLSRKPLDADGNSIAAPITLTGKLLNVKPPESDSEGNDPTTLELECGLNRALA